MEVGQKTAEVGQKTMEVGQKPDFDTIMKNYRKVECIIKEITSYTLQL